MAAVHTDSATCMFQHKALSLTYGSTQIYNLLFQDDILNIQTSTNDLNKANKVYSVFETNNRPKFHEEKSVWMAKGNEYSKVYLNNKELLRTHEYKYLGDIITPDNKYDRLIETRKATVRGATAELSAIIYEISTSVNIKTIKTYYEVTIIPKLLLNCESWSRLTLKSEQELESIQNTSIKRLLRMPITTPSVILRAELEIWTIKTE